MLLVGGCAADHEVLDVVAGELEELDLAVARGNVLGRHGPRAAVAVGLVLTFARAGGAVSEPLVLALRRRRRGGRRAGRGVRGGGRAGHRR